ncbi:DUF4112 domain-containing protein [Roseivivax isoporae]|uniref:DUF4112 domain-containing protein n=1 Tax=Roseivivax isoporae TaxID=591206 RepID=UPI0004BC33B3|nr:DUF4112 domain-containing protein [Roseivivax isoporae]
MEKVHRMPPGAAAPGVTDDIARLHRIERIAHRMDRAFRLPGTGIRVGWDSIVGLVPGVGDTLAALPAAYILHSAYRMGVPTPTLVQMGANVGIDWLIGLVPLVGDLFDVGFKSNSKNAALLRRHLESRHGAVPPSQ